MAYSTITKSKAHFDTNLYQANGSGKTISGMNFEPGMVWTKNRDSASYIHAIVDQVRGGTKKLFPNDTGSGVGTDANAVTAFNSDGYTFGSSGSFNNGTDGYVNWCFGAGGSAPTQTYTVKVVSDSGNKYRFDDFGTSAVTLDLQEGGTYTFDVSDSTMNSHPFVIGTAANSSEYSTGVTYKLDGVTKTYSQYTSGFSSATSRQLIITLAASAPALYYWCSVHSGMGGAINTNTSFGSSNFDGTTQSVVSANTTAGFSIVKYSGTGSQATIGHDLGVTPDVMIIRRIDGSEDWAVYHQYNGAGKYQALNTTEAQSSNNNRFNVAPTTSVFTVNTHSSVNHSGGTHIAYCFRNVPGYSSFGSYVGNGNASYGPFVNLGFRPSLVIVKNTSQTDSWFMNDDKRDGFNQDNEYLFTDLSTAEGSGVNRINFFSNGFKTATNDKSHNTNGNNYIYLAWGQPIVAGNNIPNNAR